MSWEVRTMLSVKSCFNPTLFCKNLMRFWPIWALYGAMWLLALPLSIFNVEYWGGKWNMDNAQRIPLSLLESGGLRSEEHTSELQSPS